MCFGFSLGILSYHGHSLALLCPLGGLTGSHGCDEGCSSTGTILRQHEVERDVWLHELPDLLHHSVMELGMESVNRSVHSNLQVKIINHSIQLWT